MTTQDGCRISVTLTEAEAVALGVFVRQLERENLRDASDPALKSAAERITKTLMAQKALDSALAAHRTRCDCTLVGTRGTRCRNGQAVDAAVKRLRELEAEPHS